MYTTTLKRLRENHACSRGYSLIANHVGQEFEGEIPLLTILEVNGLADCIWAFRATDGGMELAVKFAIACTRRHFNDSAWIAWADKWLSGEDRSIEAAAEARAARAARAAEAWAARSAEAWAARAAEAWAAEAWAAAARAAEAARAAAAAEHTVQIEILRELLK